MGRPNYVERGPRATLHSCDMSTQAGIGAWGEAKTSGVANIASNDSDIGSGIADLATAFTLTAIPVEGQPSFLCGTSACRTCRTVQFNAKFAPPWSHICSPASAEDVSGADRPLVARTVRNHFPLSLQPRISKTMRPAPKRAGAGRGIGADYIASSSRKGQFTITSDRPS